MLSAFLPGAGQWLARRRRRGGALLGVTALGIGVGAAVAWTVWSGAGLDLLGRLLRPEGFVALLAANVLIALFRLFATVDAWAVARSGGGRGGPLQAGALAALVAVVVLAPHAALGYAGGEARRVVEAVFAPVQGVAVAADREARGAADDEPEADTGGEAGGSGPSEPPPELADSEDVRGPAVEQGVRPAETGLLADHDRLTVLMLGSDAGPGRSGTRVDALVVASIDVESGEVALISVPRNMADVPMPDGIFAQRLGARYPLRLMSLYPEAEADEVLAREFEEPGRQAHVAAVEALLGLQIDHVAMVDLAGFIDVIDAFGGVDVDVSDPIRVRLSPPRPGEDWRSYDIPAGRQQLDGHEAHAYVRSRTGTDDYDRMRRQRCLVGSLIDDIEMVPLLRALPSLADVLVERVRTDISVDTLPDLARLAGRVDIGGMRTLGLTPPTYTNGQNAHGFFSADVPRIQQAVRDLLDRAETAPAGASDLASTCG